MKLNTLFIAFLVSIVLATITPPIFTSHAASQQKAAVTSIVIVNTDSLALTKDTSKTQSPWIDPTKLPPADTAGIFGIGAARLLAYLTGLITLLMMLFPTLSENKWYLWIFNLIAFFIPNFKSGGGVHQMNLFYSLYQYFFAKKV